MQSESSTVTRLGRAPATTRRALSHTALDLFLERGFDGTVVDDIAAAAGISKRTFFRYFASKNDLPWGEFDDLIADLRTRLRHSDPRRPVRAVLQDAIVAVNRYPVEELPYHRERMRLLLTVPSLAAHATLRYAAWRGVVAEYVAERRREPVDALFPQAIAWASLGLCVSAYEQWVADDTSELPELLGAAFTAATAWFGKPPTATDERES